jgi:hypothetical protein
MIRLMRLVPFLLLGAFGGAGLAQTVTVAELPGLRLEKTVKTSFPSSGGRWSTLKANRSGDVYFQLAPRGNGTQGAVVRISGDGRNQTEFDLGKVSASEVSGRPYQIRAFEIDKQGNVYLLAALGDKPESSALARDKPRPPGGASRIAIIQFDSDGRYESALFLNHMFEPSRITFISDGSFWVSGASFPGTSIDVPPQPFLGLVSSQGDVRVVELADDPAKEFASAVPKGLPREQLSTMAINAPSALGSDGNIYFLRGGNPAHAFVVTIGGDVLRHFKLKVPVEGAHVTDLKVADGKILVCYSVPRSTSGEGSNSLTPIYSLYDMEDGNLIGTYRGSEEVRGSLAGYSAENGFEFLTAIDGYHAIKYGRP